MMSIKEKIFQVLDETLFRVFDIASQGISILRDIWDQSWQTFILIIKTTYPNVLHS